MAGCAVKEATPDERSTKVDAARARAWRGRDVLIVSAVALGVRLLHVYQTADVPFVRMPVGDAAGYLAWAQTIAAGRWFGEAPFYQAPLYPYFLAVLLKLGWGDVASVRLIQAVCGAAAAGLMTVAVSNWFNRRIGVAAGLMLAFYAPAIFYDGLIQKTSLAGLLTCALLAVLSMARDASRTRPWAVAGVLAALLSLVRENALIWIPLMLIAAVGPKRFGTRRAGFLRAAVFLSGVLMILGPVAVRNYTLGGGLWPTTSQFGPNFYIGNHTGADGRYEPLVRGHETPAFERADATRLAEEAMGRTLSPSEVSRYWTRRAWTDIRSDPAAWVRLLGRKLMMVLNDYEVSDAEGVIVYAEASPVLAAIACVWRFGVLFPLACAGMFLSRAAWPRLWILWAMFGTMVAGVALFFVLGRYRYPLVPLLLPFAAAGLIHLFALARTRRWSEWGQAMAIAAAAAGVAFWPVHDVRRLDALAWMNAGVSLAQQGDLTGAIAYFEAAIKGHPDSPEANVNLAQALAQRGERTGDVRDFARAVAHYQRAARTAPELPGLWYNLGVALERIGEDQEARRAYEQALRVDPHDEAARRALRRLQGS